MPLDPTSNDIQTFNQGDTIVIQAVATDQITLQYVTDPTVTVYFYNPSKDPEHNSTDRGAPDATVTAVYDADVNGFLATTTATGSIVLPGVWTYRVVFIGATYQQTEYDEFVLNP